MTFGKRQLVIGALVAALGAAVYLNWQFSGARPVAVTDSPESSVAEKQLGKTTYVNTEISGEEASLEQESGGSTAEESSTVSDVSETSSTLTQEQREFFGSERSKREQLQEKTMEDLTELAEAADGSENTKNEAVKAAQELAEVFKKQADIEAEIRTKGFEDCIVSINNGRCTVILTKEELNDATAITVKDIVNRQAGISFENITIASY